MNENANRDLFITEAIINYLQRLYPNEYSDAVIIKKYKKYIELSTRKKAAEENDNVKFTTKDAAKLEELNIYFYGNSDGSRTSTGDGIAAKYVRTIENIKAMINSNDNSIKDVVTNIYQILDFDDSTTKEATDKYINEIIIPGLLSESSSAAKITDFTLTNKVINEGIDESLFSKIISDANIEKTRKDEQQKADIEKYKTEQNARDDKIKEENKRKNEEEKTKISKEYIKIINEKFEEIQNLIYTSNYKIYYNKIINEYITKTLNTETDREEIKILNDLQSHIKLLKMGGAKTEEDIVKEIEILNKEDLKKKEELLDKLKKEKESQTQNYEREKLHLISNHTIILDKQKINIKYKEEKENIDNNIADIEKDIEQIKEILNKIESIDIRTGTQVAASVPTQIINDEDREKIKNIIHRYRQLKISFDESIENLENFIKKLETFIDNKKSELIILTKQIDENETSIRQMENKNRKINTIEKTIEKTIEELESKISTLESSVSINTDLTKNKLEELEKVRVKIKEDAEKYEDFTIEEEHTILFLNEIKLYFKLYKKKEELNKTENQNKNNDDIKEIYKDFIKLYDKFIIIHNQIKINLSISNEKYDFDTKTIKNKFKSITDLFYKIIYSNIIRSKFIVEKSLLELIIIYNLPDKIINYIVDIISKRIFKKHHNIGEIKRIFKKHHNIGEIKSIYKKIPTKNWSNLTEILVKRREVKGGNKEIDDDIVLLTILNQQPNYAIYSKNITENTDLLISINYLRI